MAMSLHWSIILYKMIKFLAKTILQITNRFSNCNSFVSLIRNSRYFCICTWIDLTLLWRIYSINISNTFGSNHSFDYFLNNSWLIFLFYISCWLFFIWIIHFFLLRSILIISFGHRLILISNIRSYWSFSCSLLL